MSDAWALARYQAIAAYIALTPERGGRIAAARLVKQALDAIWWVHGEEMAANLYDIPPGRWHEVLPDACQDTDDEEIPF